MNAVHELATTMERLKLRRSRVVRVLVGLIVASLTVGLLYVVAVNLFLSTSLFVRIVDYEPQTVDIHYERAWSWFPGRIHATGVSIRSRDSHLDFILKVERVDFDISFLSLARKRFDLSNVTGRGISLRVRPRLESPPTSVADYADLPPIEGLGDYAVSSGVESPDKWDDTKWHLWTIDLEKVDAQEVREVWIGPARFEGLVDVVGRFYLKPVRLANVGPCHVDVHRGAVHVGARPVISDLSGTMEVSLRDFDARFLPGVQLLRYASVSTALRGHAEWSSTLADGATFAAAMDVSKLALVVRDGALSSGTAIDAEIVDAHAGRLDAEVSGRAHVMLGVREDAGTARASFAVEASQLHARRTNLDAPSFARIDQLSIVGDSAALDLVAPFGDLHARVDVPDLEIADGRAINDALPSDARVLVHGGSVRADLDVEVWLADKQVRGSARVAGRALDLTVGPARLVGAARIELGFAAFAWDTQRFTDARVSVELEKIAVALDSEPGVAIVRSDHLVVTARAPIVDVADPLARIDVVASMPSALVIDSGTVRAFLARGSVSRVNSGDAAFSLRGDGRIASAVGRSTFELESPRLGFVYKSLSFAGDAHARLRAHNFRWRHGDLALDEASLDLTHVAISPVSRASGALPALTIEKVAIRAESPTLAFAHPFASLAMKLDVVAGRVHDSAALDALLPARAKLGFESDGAAFSAEAHGSLVDGTVRGDLMLRARDVGIGGKSVHVKGDVSLVLDKIAWKISRRSLSIEGGALLVRGITGRFDGNTPQFTIRRIVVIGRAKDLDLAHASLAGLDAQIGVDDVVLPRVEDAAPLLPSDSVVGIESGRLKASLSLAISSEKKSTTGSLDLDLHDGGVRFHTAHYEGDFKLAGTLSALDATNGMLDFSGSVLTMRHVLVTHAATATSRWHGDLHFERAALHIGDPFVVDAYVALDARDADPLLAVALGDDLPDIVAGLVEMPHLVGTAHLTIGTGKFSIQELEASGGDLSLHGIYAAKDHHVRGAFSITKGPLAAGVRIDDQGAQLRLFDLDRWLREQTGATMQLIEDDPDEDLVPSVLPTSALD
ncbi:MAG: hypothetical protein ACHREM_09285 [Polyangiales bacterium]